MRISEDELTLSPALRTAVDKLSKTGRPPSINLPALARRDVKSMQAWVANPGYSFVSCDFSSLEPSITAHYSQDPYYAYSTYGGIGKVPHLDEAGVLLIDDIYLMTASVMPSLQAPVIKAFSDPALAAMWLSDKDGLYKLVPELKTARNRAKPACLGFSYSMGPKRFVAQSYESGIIVTMTEAKAMHAAYWKLFAGVQAFSKKLSALVDRNGYIINPFGYRLTPESRKAFNAFIQSSASGVVDILSLIFFKKLQDAKIPYIFIMYCHDEIVFQVPKDSLESVRLIKEQAVVELNATLNFSIPMRLSWAACDDFSGFK